MLNLPKLREYQHNLKNDAYQILRKKKANRVLIWAATGAGKTVVAGAIAYDAVRARKKVAFVVPYDCLIKQTFDSMEKWGLECGIVAGGYRENRLAPVQICSFQTLGIRNIDWLKADVTIADECHFTSFTEAMLRRFPALPGREGEGILFGFTATPWRLKKNESLGDIYPHIVCAPTPAELIERSFLVQPVYYGLQNPQGSMIADIDYIVKTWQGLAQNSQTIAFCPSVKFAINLVEAFQEKGVTAQVIHGGTRKRDRYYDAFKNEEIRILASCNALSAGFDAPIARCAIFAIDTVSRSRFFQMLGRVTRPYKYPDGLTKTDCLVLDYMGIVPRFCRLEELKVSKSDLFTDDNVAPTGTPPMKVCLNCKGYNHISSRVCKYCGEEFEIVGKERFMPFGEMQRLWSNKEESDERSRFAYYQRLLRLAFFGGKPPEWADSKYHSRYGQYAPLDWRRNAVLPDASPKGQEEYKKYLCKVSLLYGKGDDWVGRQLSLEIGM